MRYSALTIMVFLLLSSVSQARNFEETVPFPVGEAPTPDKPEKFYDISDIKLFESCSSMGSIDGFSRTEIMDSIRFTKVNKATKDTYTIKSSKYLARVRSLKEDNNSREEFSFECTTPVSGGATVTISRNIRYNDEETAPYVRDVEQQIFTKYGEKFNRLDAKFSSTLIFAKDQSFSNIKIKEYMPDFFTYPLMASNMTGERASDNYAFSKKNSIRTSIAFIISMCQGSKDKVCNFSTYLNDFGFYQAANNVTTEFLNSKMEELVIHSDQQKLDSASQPPKL